MKLTFSKLLLPWILMDGDHVIGFFGFYSVWLCDVCFENLEFKILLGECRTQTDRRLGWMAEFEHTI